MTKRAKLIMGGLTVVLALAAAINTATARRFEPSEQRFLILFKRLSFEANGITPIVCQVSLEGSFHSRTITKVSGQLIGSITSAIVNAHPCENGNAWVLNGSEEIQGSRPQSLPWQVLYIGFRGELPRIREIEVSIQNGQFHVELLGALCLYRANSNAWMEGQILLEGGRTIGLTANTERNIPLIESNSPLCPSNGNLRGTGAVGAQRTEWTVITVRLVE